MRELIQFINWFYRVTKKGIWLIGFIPLVLDYVTTLIPANNFPLPLLNFIEQGGNWNITLVLVSMGLIISSYLVFLESEQSKEELAEKIKKITDSQPKIKVAFMESSGTTTQKMVIHLQQVPPRPDFDSIISKKRRELLSNQAWTTPTDLPKSMSKLVNTLSLSAFSAPNTNYKEEVEQYLLEFREFLEAIFEINLDRAFRIKPVVINEGMVSASSLSIEFEMPRSYERPKKHQALDRSEINKDLLRIYAIEPIEPQPTKSKLDLNVSFPMSSITDGIVPPYNLVWVLTLRKKTIIG